MNVKHKDCWYGKTLFKHVTDRDGGSEKLEGFVFQMETAPADRRGRNVHMSNKSFTMWGQRSRNQTFPRFAGFVFCLLYLRMLLVFRLYIKDGLSGRGLWLDRSLRASAELIWVQRLVFGLRSDWIKGSPLRLPTPPSRRGSGCVHLPRTVCAHWSAFRVGVCSRRTITRRFAGWFRRNMQRWSNLALPCCSMTSSFRLCSTKQTGENIKYTFLKK